MSIKKLVLVALLPLAITGCEGVDVNPPPQAGESFDPDEVRRRERFGTITGGEGFVLFERGGSSSQADPGSGGALGVNAFLWRGTLETLDFIPIASPIRSVGLSSPIGISPWKPRVSG